MNEVIILLTLVIFIVIFDYILSKKRKLKDLTGNYIIRKIPNNNYILLVEYKDDNKKTRYRKATKKDISILKELKILKYEQME